MPEEKLHSELLLKLAQRSAHGWLRQRQGGRGGANAAQAGNIQKCIESAMVYGHA